MPKIVIECLGGALEGRTFSFDSDRVTLGRRSTCDVDFGEDAKVVSGLHCEVVFEDGGWILRDLGSTNGTLLGDQPIAGPRPIEEGATFQVGLEGPKMKLVTAETGAAEDDATVVDRRIMIDPNASTVEPEPEGDAEEASAAAGDAPEASASEPGAATVPDPEPVAPKPVEPEAAPTPEAEPAAETSSAPVAASEAAPPWAPPVPSAVPPGVQPVNISGDAPSTGRTQFYMGLMDDRVHRSSKKLKFMIAGLTLALVGVVTFAIIQATQIDAGEEERNALAQQLTKAQGALDGAKSNLAATSNKLSDLRVKLETASGDAKKKLQAQAKLLEATRKKYERELQAQQKALNKLTKSSAAAETIAKTYERALFMLLLPGRSGKPVGFCTAFAVDAKGVLGTNSHCLRVIRMVQRRGGKIYARMNKHPQKTYQVVSFKQHPGYDNRKLYTHDVALLKLDLKGETLPVATKLAKVDKVRKKLGSGQAIFTMGYPGKVMNEALPVADFRAAVISRLTDFENSSGTPPSARMVWHSALTSKGTSGSPIFDGAGEVIAVNTGGLGTRSITTTDSQGRTRRELVYNATGLNFGIRIDSLHELFPYGTGTSALPTGAPPPATLPVPMPTASTPHAGVTSLTLIKNRMCSCTTKACAVATLDAFGLWYRANKHVKATDAQSATLRELGKQVAACAVKLGATAELQQKLRDLGVIKDNGGGTAGGGKSQHATSCGQAEAAFRKANSNDVKVLKQVMANVIIKCGGGCDAGDSYSCRTIDDFMKSVCKVTSKICANLCRVLTGKSSKAAACKYAPSP